MINRSFIATFFLFLILVSCKTNNKPNVIFLLTDDQRWDAFGVAGNPLIKTPNLDEMANQGVMFNNAFVTTSTSTGSRASILTGQYVTRNRIFNSKTELTDEQFQNSYPILLKKNGYKIGFIGRFGVGHGNLKREKASFDYFWGQNKEPAYQNVIASGDTVHYTDLIQRHINDFLSQTTQEQPFCLSVSFKAPHIQALDTVQLISNKRYYGLYKEDSIPIFKVNDEKYWLSLKDYYRLITGVDDVVGNLRKSLREKSLDRNTIIIFMSDNGFNMGEHGPEGKWFGYESSIRVPLLIFDPALKKSKRGQTYNEMVLNIDIAPTILQLAGIKQVNNMQGNPLSGLYKGEAKSWRDCFYYENLCHYDVISRSQGIRTEKYKYLYYPDSPDGYEEVYNLETDPDEKDNLVLNSDKKEIINMLRKKFKEQQKLAQ